MTKINYQKIIERSSFGYAFYRLILDEKGEPADYEFLEVNSAFEQLTGLNREFLIGKRICEISEGLQIETAERIRIYGEIVLRDECRIFEQYSDFLRKWYRVEVSPQGDLCFVTLFFDITELKQSTDKLIQYMKYAPDCIFIADREGRYLNVNPAACRLLGYSYDELLSKSIIDITPPERIGEEMNSFKKLMAHGYEKSETLLLRHDGTAVWVALDAVALPDGTFMAFCKDISDRKKAEIELKDFALFNQTLLNTIPAPVYYKDINGKYLGVNNAFSEFYGLSEEDMIGKTVFDIAPEPLAGIYRKMDEALFRNPGVQIYEALVNNNRGEVHDVIFHKATFKDVYGNVDGIIGVILDITERKRIERELELYFRAIQSVDQPVLITDRNGNIIRVNNAFIEMYGFDIDELKGKNPRVLNPGKDVYINFGYTDEEYEELFRSMWKAITSPDKGTWENVLINRKKDGSIIWVKLIINAVYNDDHEPVNYIALPIDISTTVQKEALTKIELYRTIAALAELRDNETGNHMRRVGIFSKLLARGYNMPEKYCNDIEIFAPLHDIGKVGILDSLLLAERNLTPEEFNIMKTHTTLGYNIVKGNRELEMVAAITLSHHEWYDGTGYPKGLKGLDIPLSARITALADVYDALRSRRPYKMEWTHEDAKRYILGKSGVQFDPDLVRIFDGISERIEAIYRELKD